MLQNVGGQILNDIYVWEEGEFLTTWKCGGLIINNKEMKMLYHVDITLECDITTYDFWKHIYHSFNIRNKTYSIGYASH